jgi:hypothetical protein
MKRTYKVVVERFGHPGELSYLVTLWDENRGFLMSHKASRLEDCMAAVTGRMVADDWAGFEVNSAEA